jgi:putative DNA primase/helicase
LATPGGVVDLRTGDLRTARPSDLVTQCTAVAPAPEGTTPTLWLATLHYLMGGDTDPQRAASLVGYLRRVCGYMLTGSVQEQVLVFGYGEGRNGKTLAVQTVARLLGDYATTFPTSMLMATQHEQHPTEVARLMGKRLAIGSETESGRKFAESKLKQLTGGDRLVARFMHRDFFEFEPTFKLFIVGNHKPDLQHVDVAMRRRLHLLPFEVTVPEDKVDPDLPAKLQAEGPAILRWMIDGCLEWQEGRDGRASGLRPPQAVLDAVEDYFQEQDTVGAWLQDCCALDPQAKTPSAGAWASWQTWCRAVGEDPGVQRALTAALARHGIRKVRGAGGTRMLGGLRVRD